MDAFQCVLGSLNALIVGAGARRAELAVAIHDAARGTALAAAVPGGE